MFQLHILSVLICIFILSLSNWDYESGFVFKSTKRKNTCFHWDSAHSKVMKDRTVHAKWTASIFVQSSKDECKYSALNAAHPHEVDHLRYKSNLSPASSLTFYIWGKVKFISRHNILLALYRPVVWMQDDQVEIYKSVMSFLFSYFQISLWYLSRIIYTHCSFGICSCSACVNWIHINYTNHKLSHY